MRRQLILVSFLGALLGAGTLHAQTSPAGQEGGKPRMMRDCSKASDPKACEERHSRMREAFRKARETCKGKEGADRRSCMTEQVCSQAKDPGKCRERAAKHGTRGSKREEFREQVKQACAGKTDDELRKCMRDERAKRRNSAPK